MTKAKPSPVIIDMEVLQTRPKNKKKNAKQAKRRKKNK